MNLPNLKELRIINCESSFRNFQFAAPNLEKLVIDDGIPLNEILENFPNLKSLTFGDRAMCYERTPDVGPAAIPHILTYLKFFFDADISTINNLLRSQRETLKELYMSTNNYQREIELAIYYMKVEKLRIFVPVLDQFNAENVCNLTVKELEVLYAGSNYDDDYKEVWLQNIKGIFRACPLVKKLIIRRYSRKIFDNFDGEILKFASRAFNLMKDLVIIYMLTDINVDINLNTTESLSLENISYFTYNFKSSCLKLLLSCKNLKKIHFKSDQKTNRNLLEYKLLYFEANDFIKILENLKALEEIDATFLFLFLSEAVNFLTLHDE